MKPKEKIDKIKKDVTEFKDKATKISQGAMKAAGTVKEVLNQGVSQSKGVLEKAGKVLNKNAISQGIDVTSRGVDMAAKGAKTLANTMEKASSNMKQMSDKLKKR